MQPNTLTRREYKNKMYVIRKNSWRIRIRKKSFRICNCLITKKTTITNSSEDGLNVRKEASFRPKGVAKNAGSIHFSFRWRFGGLQNRGRRRFTQHLGAIFHQLKMCQQKRRKNSVQAVSKRIRDRSSLKLGTPLKINLEKSVKILKIWRWRTKRRPLQ